MCEPCPGILLGQHRLRRLRDQQAPGPERAVRRTSRRDRLDPTANLVTLAIYHAVEAVKGCVERWKKRQRVSQPEFTSWFMDYDKRSSTIHRSQASLSTVAGRVVCGYVFPRSSPTPYERYVLGGKYDFGRGRSTATKRPAISPCISRSDGTTTTRTRKPTIQQIPSTRRSSVSISV